MAEKLVNPPDYYCSLETENQRAREGKLLETSVLALERAWEWVPLHSLNNFSLLLPFHLLLDDELDSDGAVCSPFVRSYAL